MLTMLYGAPPIWRIYNGGFSVTDHKEAAELCSSQGIPILTLTASPLTYVLLKGFFGS